MSNIMVRQLNRRDSSQLLSLLTARYAQLKLGKHNRSETIVEEQHQRYMDTYMDFSWEENDLPHPDHTGRCYGVWHDGELIASLTQIFSAKQVGSFHLGNLVIKPGLNTLYEVAQNGISTAVDLAVEDAEAHGYTTFYWITALKGWNYREDKWFNASRTFKRYNVFIENIIPKGVEPKFDYEKTVLGGVTHNIPIAIKSAKLKPHLRHQTFQSQGLLKYDYVPLQESNMPGAKAMNIEENAVMIDTAGVHKWNGTEWVDMVTMTSDLFKQAQPAANTNTPARPVKQEFNCREISYEEIMKYQDVFKAQLLPLEHEYYEAMDTFRGAEWHFFVAELDGEPVSFTGLGLQKDINRIYHRSSLTMPGKEGLGGWTAVWNYKINEIARNGWSEYDTIHYVLTKHEDSRYNSRGWKNWQTRVVLYEGKTYEQTVWYTNWTDLIEHPKQAPHVNV